MVDRNAAFRQHFLKVAIADRIATIPAHRPQDRITLEMAPLEIRHRSVRPISAKHAQASRFLQQSLYAFDGNPIVSLMAEESIRALARSLPLIKADPTDAKARGDALYGCWLAGSVLGAASVALHHKLCHTLGGTSDMPHAQTHTPVLPHAIAYNAPATPDAMAPASRALGGGDPATRRYELARQLGAEMSLATLALPRDGESNSPNTALP